MTFDQFCDEVNALAQAEVDRLMAEYRAGKRLFGAEHFTFSRGMLEWHYAKRQTPEQAYADIAGTPND